MRGKIITWLTAALWIISELAAVTLIILTRLVYYSENGQAGGIASALSVVVISLFALLAIQGIGYAVSVIRNHKYWRDLGKTLFWLGAVLFFGILTIPVYWYRYILNKEYYI